MSEICLYNGFLPQAPRRSRITLLALAGGGKPSTWLPPRGLVEHSEIHPPNLTPILNRGASRSENIDLSETFRSLRDYLHQKLLGGIRVISKSNDALKQTSEYKTQIPHIGPFVKNDELAGDALQTCWRR